MYQRIAVVYDESAASERALQTAVSLASVLVAEVAIVCVTKPLPGYTAYAETVDPQVARILEDDHQSFYVQRETNAASIAEGAKVAYSVHIVEGNQEEGVLAILRACASDLLVIGLHARGLLIARLWSTAYELAQDAPCSVLGVH